MTTRSPAEPRITLLTKPGCHLCDDARRVVERLGQPWVERDITADPAEAERYAELIPVVLVDGVEVARWRVDETRLRAALGGRRRRWWRR